VSRLKLKVAESRAVRILLRVAAAESVAIAGVLAYAVIHTAASSRGARTGVAIGYGAGAIALAALAVLLAWHSFRWSRASRAPA